MANLWGEGNGEELEDWQLEQLARYQRSVSEYEATQERKRPKPAREYTSAPDYWGVRPIRAAAPRIVYAPAVPREAPTLNRPARLAQVKSIVRENPDLNKEEINARLQQIFGVGLRHSDILKERRSVFKDTPKLIPAKSLTTRYVRSIFGSQNERRFTKLKELAIWTPGEILSLSQLPLSRLKYLEAMAQNRKNLINQMKIQKKANHWSNAEYKRRLKEAIEAEYRERNWLNRKGEGEIFRMLDDFRQVLINEGINPSPGGRRSVFRNPDGTLRLRRYKGDTTGQKRRYRELHPDTIREQRQSYHRRLKMRAR